MHVLTLKEISFHYEQFVHKKVNSTNIFFIYSNTSVDRESHLLDYSSKYASQ